MQGVTAARCCTASVSRRVRDRYGEKYAGRWTSGSGQDSEHHETGANPHVFYTFAPTS